VARTESRNRRGGLRVYTCWLVFIVSVLGSRRETFHNFAPPSNQVRTKIVVKIPEDRLTQTTLKCQPWCLESRVVEDAMTLAGLAVDQ
jgi:hypothetical protein